MPFLVVPPESPVPGHAKAYQALSRQAATFHQQFLQSGLFHSRPRSNKGRV
jgi:hypothetical protein